MSVLQINSLTKHYGRITALDAVSFEVPKGAVFGILGPNGSGKTTLLSIFLNVLQASGGSYRLFDEEPRDEHRRKMGALLETPNFYHYLSAVRNLKINAAIKEKGEEEIDSVLQTVNLYERRNSAFSTYSLGMKQRLAIGSALLGRPDVLVFDEPTNGLDPVGIAEIRNLIKKLAAEGKTIIMASHLLDEVQKVCTHVAILKKGKLVATGAVSDIFRTDDVAELRSADPQQLASLLQGRSGVKSVSINNEVVEVAFEEGHTDPASLNKFCFDNGIVLSGINLKEHSLETKFLELTSKA